MSNIDNGDPELIDILMQGATSFTTGDQASILNSTSIRGISFGVILPTTYSGGLWSDGGGRPGALLEAYPSRVQPAGAVTVTFASGGIELQAHTTYWLEVSIFSSTAYWLDTHLTTDESNYGWTIGDVTLGGSGSDWAEYPADSFGRRPVGRMAVDVTFVPEPGVLGVVGLAIAAVGRRRRGV